MRCRGERLPRHRISYSGAMTTLHVRSARGKDTVAQIVLPGKATVMANQASSPSHVKWMYEYHIILAPKHGRKATCSQYQDSRIPRARCSGSCAGARGPYLMSCLRGSLGALDRILLFLWQPRLPQKPTLSVETGLEPKGSIPRRPREMRAKASFKGMSE